MNDPSSSASLRQALDAHQGEIVLRICGYSEDFQFWLTPFSAGELEEWWQEQELFDSDPCEDYPEIARIFGVEEEPPPHREQPVPGVFLDAEYPEGTEIWDELALFGRHYRCVICCECDSYLQRPDKSKVYHRGSNRLRE